MLILFSAGAAPENKNLFIRRGNMKKQLLLAGGAIAAALVMTGCAGVGTTNGGVSALSMGPNFYSEVSGNAILNETPGKFTVVKRDVTATGTLKSYFTCVNIGDVSYATLKAEALKQAPGANDLVGVKMDYKMSNVCGVNTITVTLTGTAVKF